MSCCRLRVLRLCYQNEWFTSCPYMILYSPAIRGGRVVGTCGFP